MSKLKSLLILAGIWLIHEYIGASFGYKNYGTSLGMFWGYSWLLNILGIILVVWLWRKGEWLIAVGGIVNLSDRIRFSYVRDYWKIPMLPVYNNIADWVIALGVGLFIIKLLWKKLK